MAVMVEVRDGDLNSIGPLTWTKVDLTARYNAVGAWSITVPATDKNIELTNIPSLGVVVDWNGVYRFTGPMETWAPSKSLDDAGQVTDTITLSGADDLALIANRTAYPDPASSWASQTVSGEDAQTAVPCETAIKHYVNVNAGPGALAARRAPHLTVASSLGMGGTVSYSARFADGVDLELMDIIRLLIASGGPLGVTVTQQGGSLVFDTYEPRDLSETAWFSFALGNLRGVDLSDAAPTITNALVRGSTTFVEVAGAGAGDPWRRIETIVDQSSSTDSTEMTQAGQDALSQGAGAAQMSISTVDLPLLSFGTDYGLGDTVTVEVRDGVTYQDIVSAVQLTADDSGQNYVETATPTVGASESDIGDDQTASAQLAARVRALEKQIRRLQAG